MSIITFITPEYHIKDNKLISLPTRLYYIINFLRPRSIFSDSRDLSSEMPTFITWLRRR
jgi:hypothetical protein